MKTLCLFILSFLMLFNQKVQAKESAHLLIHPFTEKEAYIDSLSPVKKVNSEEAFNNNLVKFHQLLDIFKKFRIYNNKLAINSLKKIQNKKTLSGDDLYLLKKSFQIHYKLNSKMLEFAASSKPKFSFNSKDEKLAADIKKDLMWTTSHLLPLEHFLELYELLYKTDGEMRRIIKNIVSEKNQGNEINVSFRKYIYQLQTFIEVCESQKFYRQINFYRAAYKSLLKDLKKEERLQSLLKEINENNLAQKISRGERYYLIEDYRVTDTAVKILNKITNFLSGFFGNIAGSIKWRKGYFYENPEALKLAKRNLRPMDILLEKSPFVLTDKFIPGHYGHVAIYLGTKKELDKIGMWDHPSIAPYQQDIINGKVILEAVRPGVRLTSIEEFMNIDEFTVMRKKDALKSSEVLDEQIMRGMEQIGKAYDFNFDISTLDKIVCSELIYIVFGNVKWPTANRLGRTTITPDDIAEELFFKGTYFKITNYILSTERQEIHESNIYELAKDYDYEVRAENGQEVSDPRDESNSFWKKETKCYNVRVPGNPVHNVGGPSYRKKCNTTYREFQYEEVGL